MFEILTPPFQKNISRSTTSLLCHGTTLPYPSYRPYKCALSALWDVPSLNIPWTEQLPHCPCRQRLHCVPFCLGALSATSTHWAQLAPKPLLSDHPCGPPRPWPLRGTGARPPQVSCSPLPSAASKLSTSCPITQLSHACQTLPPNGGASSCASCLYKWHLLF